MGQVINRRQIENILGPIRGRGDLVFTNGCFDILHVGHVRYLIDAKKLGQFLIVGLNSDSSVRGLKGPERPIQVQDDRAEVLAGLASVDFVVLFDEPTPLELIREVRPQILVKGGDWKPEQIVGSDFVKSTGGRVLSLPFHPGRSSTNLVEKLKSL